MTCQCCSAVTPAIKLGGQVRRVAKSKFGFPPLIFPPPGEPIPFYLTETVHFFCQECAPCGGTTTYDQDGNISGGIIPAGCNGGASLGGTVGDPSCTVTSTSATCAAETEDGNFTTLTGNLTNEYTTEMLITKVTALLADTEWRDGTGYAQTLVEEDERTVELTDMRWRIEHEPSISCFLKVWLKKTITAPGADPSTPEVTTEDLPPYVWTGDGTPCIPGAHAGEKINGDWTEIAHPADRNTFIAVSIVKVSCLRDFEPEDGNLSGYPP